MATQHPKNPYAAAQPPQPAMRRRRGWRVARWSLAGLLACAMALIAIAWWWAGVDTSLATTLSRAARHMPAGQTLESRDVRGSLRRGGEIGWLRWSGPSMAVEVRNARIGWHWGPLLHRKIQLGEVHAAHVQITPLGPGGAEPTQPLEQLPLPVRVALPFRVDEGVWASASPLTIRNLAGAYDFDGERHQLRIENVEIAQGRYSAQATLGAQAPMPLDASLNGRVRTTAPGADSDIEATAHATVQGTLATAAARLQIQAQLQTALATAAPAAPSAPASAASRPPKSRRAANPAPPRPAIAPGEPLQAHVQAQIAPWLAQPLLQAQADLRALDLAALWPQAPTTRLSGTVRVAPHKTTAEPPPVTVNGAATTSPGWDITAQLQNTLPGPWDQRRLPLDAVTAQAAFDGAQWTVPHASMRVGAGSIDLQGEYTPATQALHGTANVRALRPSALHTALDGTPLAGLATAQGNAEGAVRFSANILATAPRGSTVPRGTGNAPLRLDRLQTEGIWHDRQLRVSTLQLDALQTQVSARQVQIGLNDASVQGQVQASVPGTTMRINGLLAARSGSGTLNLRIADAQQTQRWIESLPGLATALQGATLQGNAQLETRWNGGWQHLQRQLQMAGLIAGQPDPQSAGSFDLQARLGATRLQVDMPPRPGAQTGPLALELRDVQAEFTGSVQQAALAWDGELRQGGQRATLHARATGGSAATGQWNAQVNELHAQWAPPDHPGPWTMRLAQPLTITARQKPTLRVETSAGQATVSGPVAGQARLRWQPMRYTQTAQGALQLRTQGELLGLPTAWADAFTPDGQPALQRLGLAGNLMLDAQWDIDAADTLHASASLRRASGDIRVLTGEAPATVVHSSGQGTGAGATPPATPAPGTPAGIRQAEVHLDAQGTTVRARVLWDSTSAGTVQAEGSTQLTQADGGWTWPADAPLAATIKAQLPDVGVWTALAPPGWRVKGTLQANAALSGTRTAPRWGGTLGADQMAVRSLLDGVDLKDGRLRASLQGDRLEIAEFRVNGGQGNHARIAGYSGNRTAAPKNGGSLTGTGTISWAGLASAEGSGSGSGIAMDFNAEAQALQVLVRTDRQISVSGQLNARLQQGQFTLRGKLTTDRATIILPEAGAPALGSDVVVHSAVKDREAQRKAQQVAEATGRVEAAKPPDIAITFNLGNDFALQGYGITTRLTGELNIRGPSVAGGPPRVSGEVKTEEGRYRAWGQSLNVETGLLRFNGPYDNPALDVLAIRPNISVRAGVQVTGTAKAPRVALYSDSELTDAETLSWVVLGRDATAGGAEAALLQQAALALLGGSGGTGNIAQRVGLDEIGFKGSSSGEDASAAALTFGKRLSKDIYVTYERSLSGTLGTLYIFYDLSKRLTLRGQTGTLSAVDLIYTLRYD